jgi:2-C-methyl-D-erythritol 2,4-cyclodiphosphate synthase
LIHALIDALLGALALGDIGDHFPPSDPRYRDISSVILLKQVMEEVRDRGYGVVNVDCTVILESPRLTGYKAAIARNLEALLGLAAGTVSVKAKTAEGTGPVGAGKAAEAKAVVLLDRS